MQFLIGIDEVGRGPLAGPVAVGVVKVSADFDWSLIPGVTDSKKLTEAKREEIFVLARELKKEGLLDFSVAMVGAKYIDEKGIVWAIKAAQGRVLARAAVPHDAYLKLDGGLKAPQQFQHQETIIKGDQKERVIGLASIVAKVTRDRYMRRIAALPQFAAYTFATHKGYGTKAHRAAIQTYGLTEQHRKTFCRNLLVL